MQDVMVHKHYISVSDWHCQLCKNNFLFYQYFEGDSPILLLWFMLLAYISNLWILWAKSITVKPLLFAAINVWSFYEQDYFATIKVCVFMRNISLIYCILWSEWVNFFILRQRFCTSLAKLGRWGWWWGWGWLKLKPEYPYLIMLIHTKNTQN